jgi:hypothetical protein
MPNPINAAEIDTRKIMNCIRFMLLSTLVACFTNVALGLIDPLHACLITK